MISHVRASSFGSSGSARSRTIGALAIALLALLLVPALSSAAAPQRSFLEPFGPAQQPSLGKPAGMTVDPATGDLYVIDLQDKTLHRYNPDGSPDNFSALSDNVIDGHAGEADATSSGEVLHTEGGQAYEAEVAVAPPGAAGGTEGDIYLTSPINGVIDVFDQSGALITEKAISSFPCGVAVDPKGNVFVGSFEGENAGITKLTPTSPGAFEESEASPYPLISACQVAASEGSVYGAEYSGAVHKFPSEGAEEGTEQYQVTSSVSGSISIDPQSGRLLVPREGGSQIEEYIVSGSKEAALVSTVDLASTPRGVAVNGESGELFASREGSGGVEVYGPLPQRSFLEPFGPAQQPSLGKPAGMTVDPATGDLYVIDLQDKTLHRYNPDGSPDNFSALSDNVIDGHAGEADATSSGEVLHTEGGQAYEAEVAVAPPGAAGGTEGDIYLTSPINGVIDVFDQSGALITEKAISSFPCGVAVDPLGNVFVGSFEGEDAGITKLTPTAPGTFEESAASPYPLLSACQVAASEGSVYGAEYSGAVHKFPSEGAEEGTEQYQVTSSVSGSISIDPQSGRLLVPREGGSQIEEYIVSGSKEAALVSTVDLASTPRGVAVNGESGELFASREGSGGVEVYGFASATPEFTLAVHLTGNGSGSVKCEVGASGTPEPCAPRYPEGTELALVPLAATHSQLGQFENASGSAAANCEQTQACQFTIQADSAVDARFDKKTHTLGITITGTGSGTVQCKIGAGSFGSCAGAIDEGEAVTVKGTAAQYSTFVGWSAGTGSASSCTGASECSFDLEADSTLKATFDRNTHTLAVTIDGTGAGAVACKIGSGSFGSCGIPLPEGEQITVKATEAAHSVFQGFSAGAGSAIGCSGAGSHECSFQLLADGALTATYTRLTHSLSVSTTGTGTGEVKCKLGEGQEEPCKATYNEHAQITLVAHPAANSSFAGFSGTGSASNCSSAASCTFFLEADSSATAQMNAVKAPVTPTGGGGSGSKPNPPPPPSHCLVPKLKGLSLTKAKSELAKANCQAGKVAKPKAKKAAALVVRSSKPGAGSTLPAGDEVDLTLAPKPKNKRGKK